MKPPHEIFGNRILFLGAHCDDIEIGCGGTAARLSAEGRQVAFAVAADCGPNRKEEAEAAAQRLKLRESKGNFFLGVIADGRLEERKDVLQNWLKQVRERFRPDTIFVHFGGDTHPDHESLFKVAIRVFSQESLILYAIAKPLPQTVEFRPNYTVDITSYIQDKLDLCACHKSQAGKAVYLNPEQLRDLARIAYCSAYGKVGGYAEAFLIHVSRSPREEAGAPSIAPENPNRTPEPHLPPEQDISSKSSPAHPESQADMPVPPTNPALSPPPAKASKNAACGQVGNGKPERITLALGIVLLTIFAGIFCRSLEFPPVFWSYDSLCLVSTAKAPELTNVLIVAMDERSHRVLHQDSSPEGKRWSRLLHAQLLEHLKAMGARAVAFDLLFDQTSEVTAADAAFAASIRTNGPVVLGSKWPYEGGEEQIPITNFQSGASYGLVNLRQDQDKIVRRHFRSNHPEGTNFTDPIIEALKLKMADPTTERWLRFYSDATTIPHISYHELVGSNATNNAVAVTNRVVFVGRTGRFTSNAGDAHYDSFKTPVGIYSGVEMQATTFLNVIRNDWLERLPFTTEILLLICSALVQGFGFLRWHLRGLFLATISVIIGSVLGALVLLNYDIWYAWAVVVFVQIPVAWLPPIFLYARHLYISRGKRGGRKSHPAGKKVAADLTTANLGDIAVSDQKSNAPHPQMTGAEEPDRVSRLYTPKRCVTANSPAVAEEQNQIRRVEAAVPAHAILQKPIDLIVQVRLPGSSVLGESIADWPCHKKPGEASNDSGEIPVFFPISPKTGLLAAAKLRVEVMPGDFIVRGRSKAELEVPPEGNSKIVFFSLIPTKSGKCHIHVQIFTLKGDYLGTLPMLTNVNGSSAESGSKVRLELWIHVSSDGVVEPIQKPRINPVMQQTMLKTLRDEPGQLLLNELIRVYHEASAIHELLHRAGLSVCYVVPSGQTVAILWQLIAEQIDSGRVKNGFDKLLAQVQQEYPGNAMFHKYAVMPEVRVGAEKAFNSDFLNKRVSEADVIDLLSATPSVKLEDYRVVGQYYRYQSKVATSLRKAAHKIVEDCRKGIGLYHNFLIWGFSGEGKTYFARQVAAEAGIACGEISLASATEVPDEATLKRHLAAAQAKGGPYLFIVDEIDKRTEDPWIYPGLFYSLSSRAANPNGNTVFVLIGSTGESLDVFWEEMERKKGGPDLKTRIPHDQVIIIPPTILGDRLLVVLSEIRKQGVQKSLSIKRIDKLALAYLLLSPNATPRGIEGMVMKAIERLVSGGGDTELSYGHFFDFGDVGQTKFITQYPSVHTALHEDSLRFD